MNASRACTPRHLCRRPLTGVLVSAGILFASPALADDSVDATLERMVVTATRSDIDADKVPATITLIDRKDIDSRLPGDEADLFANEPDVVMSRDLRRYGSSTINIRGIEGNRVLQQVDGVRLPDAYNGGGPTNTTGAPSDSPEFDFLKRAEILRGPASSLYGSDALGGVVSYLTLDPQDLLRGRSLAARYRSTWRGADESFQNTLYFAGGNDVVEALFATTRRDGHELDNMGSVGGSGYGREKPNPQDNKSTGNLAKLIFKPAPGHRIGLTYENRSLDSDTDVLRLTPSLPRVVMMDGEDSTDRERFSGSWEWRPTDGWLDRVLLSAYRQDAESRSDTSQQRSGTSATCSATLAGVNECDVASTFTFDQKRTGLGMQLERAHDFGTAGVHLFTFGADWYRHEVAEMRDTTVYNRTTGTTSKSLAGDTFPLRDFAPGETRSLGVFVQDEIALLDERLIITPALRYDRVKLQPEATSKTIGTGTFHAVSQSHEAFSPKIAALWQATPDVALYAQVVRGFRAPNYNEVNGLFHNTAQRYASIPNPDLKPEKSTGYEIGTRFKALGGNLKLALYDNHYTDFISHEIICSAATTPCTLGPLATTVYQDINFSRARIWGAELRGTWKLPANFHFGFAAAFARGDGKAEGASDEQPLDQIEPLRLIATLGWQGSLDGRPLGVETHLRAAAAKHKSRAAPIDASKEYFLPSGYGVVDLGAWWQVHRNARVNFALNNLFDKKHWLWSDVRQVGLASTDDGPAFYTQPGRNLSVSLQVDF